MANIGIGVGLLLTAILSALTIAGCEKPTHSLDPGAIAASMDISPNAKSLVFSGLGSGGNLDLYVLSLETWKVTRLTDTLASENYPGFSPNGKSIVFSRTNSANGPQYLCIMDLRTGHIRQITKGPDARDECPSFSGDGNAIVFCRQTVPGQTRDGAKALIPAYVYFDVYSVNPDGSGLKRLTRGDYSTPSWPRMQQARGTAVYAGTVPAPPHDSGSPIPDVAIKLFETADGKPPALLSTLNVGHISTTTPYLFADGRRIAYMADGARPFDYDLYVCDQSGRTPPRALHVDKLGAQPHSPVISPDGKHIYFLMGYDNSLWSVDSDGRDQHRLASGALFGDPVHWKPGM